MIRVTNIAEIDHVNKTAKVSLFADVQSEVTPTAQIQGLPAGYSIAQSSSVMTASADIAFMKSDGTWNWV